MGIQGGPCTKGQVLKENYQTLKAYQLFDIVYLNELGEDGWELVSVMSIMKMLASQPP